MKKYDILLFGDALYYEKKGLYYTQYKWAEFAVILGKTLGNYKLILPVKVYYENMNLGICEYLNKDNVFELKGWDSTKEFILRFPLFLKDLIKLKKILKPSKILILKLPSISAFFIYALAKFTNKKIKIIIWIGGNLLTMMYLNPLYKGFAKFTYFLTKIMVKNSLTFTSGGELCQLYSPYCNESIYPIVTGVISKKEIFHRVDTCTGKVIKVLRVAELIHIKGIEYLISAFKKLLDEGFNVELFIVGKGNVNYKRKLMDMAIDYGIEDKIHFVGFIPWEKDLKDMYKNSDISVISSLTEGFPRVILESWAFGLPVITTSVGGIPSIVVDGYNGLIIPSKDSNSLSIAMEKVIFNEHVRRKLIKGGYETLREYTQEKVIEFMMDKIGCYRN